MTREIKFRVWRAPTWSDGTPRNLAGGRYGDTAMLYIDFFWFEENDIYDTGDVEDRGYVLMQSTGLKDKNGTDIYEGDYVEGWTPDSEPMGVIQWGQAGFYLEVHAGYDRNSYYLSGLSGPCEVVGNIWETPLLGSPEVLHPPKEATS